MKRSKFSLSFYKLLSMKMGNLIPIGLVEVLPGDTVQHATNMLVRLQPMVAPVMHPCHARVHHWYVPFRLIWEDWEDFITGGPDGMDASAFPFKALNSTSGAEGKLADYLGVPTVAAGAPTLNVSALPFRAYATIFNEWYRDQDLQAKLVIDITSGQDTTTDTNLQFVAWEKDYFTTARPWTQKGPVVTLPLTGNAPVVNTTPNGPLQFRSVSGTNFTDGSMVANAATAFAPKTYGSPGPPGNSGVNFANPSGATADLSQVSSATINDLRLAMALQRYEEARARYGSRYTEYLRYIGVRSSDARLQRPEYLGGGKQTIQFSEVLQTGVTTSGTASGVGNLSGHGIGALRSNRYRRFFEEHGYVISLLSVKPVTVYQQGLPRTWNRRVKEDFWQRELQHIGQQEILNKEVYAKHTTPDGVFGYQDRYDEYRRMESQISGQFRSTLNYWHMARVFSADPVLNASFVQSNPTNRIFADQTGSDTLLVMASHSIQARRLVARTGTSFIF